MSCKMTNTLSIEDVPQLDALITRSSGNVIGIGMKLGTLRKRTLSQVNILQDATYIDIRIVSDKHSEGLMRIGRPKTSGRVMTT